MFLADNKTFSLDIISGLEEYAISKAWESKRYKVENSVKPKYEIDEYDLVSIEEIYDEIKFVMKHINSWIMNGTELRLILKSSKPKVLARQRKLIPTW